MSVGFKWVFLKFLNSRNVSMSCADVQVAPYDGATGRLVLHGNASAAQFSALLSTLMYENDHMVDIYAFVQSLAPR